MQFLFGSEMAEIKFDYCKTELEMKFKTDGIKTPFHCHFDLSSPLQF